MEKRSNEGIPCTYCDNISIPGTNPPVCEEHVLAKKASAEPTTLKELEVSEVD